MDLLLYFQLALEEGEREALEVGEGLWGEEKLFAF
jgi:hypothetical protein